MNIVSKATWIIGLLCSFFLIIISGKTNVKNFAAVQESIQEIYKDRLVVKGIIFDLSNYLHQKEIALIKKNYLFFQNENEAVNEQIAKGLRAFRLTVLTEYEKKILERFAKNIEDLKLYEKENNIAKNSITLNRVKDNLLQKFKSLHQDLKILSEIQLSEGKRKVSSSEVAVKSMNESEENENYILLIYCILMTIIIFVIPTEPFQGSHKEDSSN